MDQPHADTLPRFTTKADFLAWEEEQETRFEFDGEDVSEVTGGTLDHIQIMMNLTALLLTRLRGSPYKVFSQVKIETVPGYRYPDISVGPRNANGKGTVFPDPIVVFEVLSPSTAHVDLGRKREEYGDLVSIRCYVLIDSRREAAWMLAKGPAGTWVESDVKPGGFLDFPEIGARLALRDLYEDVHF